MEILESVKNKSVDRKLSREIFVNENGAIDLASIMVGIIVIGIIGGVIAATVFAIIPWAQDNAAKANLNAVKQAQSVYAGFEASKAAGAISGNPELAFINPFEAALPTTTVAASDVASFGTYKQLQDRKLLTANKTLNVATSANTQCYVAASESGSGKVFWTDSQTGQIKQYKSDTSSCMNLAQTVAEIPTIAAQTPAVSEKGSIEAFTVIVSNNKAVGYDTFHAYQTATREFTPAQFGTVPFLAQYEGQKNKTVTTPVSNVYLVAPDGTKSNLTGAGEVLVNMDDSGKVAFDVRGTTASGFVRDVNPTGVYGSFQDKFTLDGSYLHFSVNGVDQKILLMEVVY